MELEIDTLAIACGFLLNAMWSFWLFGMKAEKRFTALETKVDLLYKSFIQRTRKGE